MTEVGGDEPDGPDPSPGTTPQPPGEADVAAAAALARARAAAAEKGLRPGSAPRRTRRRPVEQTYSSSKRDGRDPALIGEQIDRLLLDRGWNVDVSAGAVMGRWPVIVGADVAAHSTPVTFTDGELLEGVRFRGGVTTTHSIVMRSKSGTIREVKSEHALDKLRTYASVDFEHAR